MRTNTSARRRRVWVGPVVAAVTALCLSAFGGSRHQVPIHGVAGPGQAPAYLALGDSYPHGSDGSGNLPNNDNYWIGYPDYLGEILDRPLVNAACPGETAVSFLSGNPLDAGPNCQPAKEAGLLHVDYSESQVAFAEGYLTAHDRVVLVTLTIGGNDFQIFAAQCQGNSSCIKNGFPAFLVTLMGNIDAILGRLRATGYAGPIVFVEYAAANYNGTTAQLQQLIYQAMQPVAEAHDVQLAPVFERFRDLSLGHGGYPCVAGLLLTNPNGSCNIHPTGLGHQLIASMIAELLLVDPPVER